MKARSMALAAALAAAVAVTGCSKSTNTAASGSSPSATVPSPASTSVASQIAALLAKGEAGQNAAFKAVYSVVSGGNTQTLTFEQKLPESLIGNAQGVFITNGSTSYFCTKSGTPTCLSETSTSGTNPMAPMMAIAEPKAVLNALQTAQAQALANSQGYTIHMSSGSYGGGSDTCATITGQGNTLEYCFNSDGVVAYESVSGGVNLTLTSYTTSVPDSDFALPASPMAIPSMTIPSMAIPSVP
jgi:hypothetical protein